MKILLGYIFPIFLFLQHSIIDIEDLQWKYRLICIESQDYDLLNKQLKEFQNKNIDLKERKLRVFIKNKEGFYEWPTKIPFEKIENFPTNKNKSFKITLIGLDGSQKFNSYSPTQAQTLFNLIDSMPMRQFEKN